jgi:hypothetical protein
MIHDLGLSLEALFSAGKDGARAAVFRDSNGFIAAQHLASTI